MVHKWLSLMTFALAFCVTSHFQASHPHIAHRESIGCILSWPQDTLNPLPRLNKHFLNWLWSHGQWYHGKPSKHWYSKIFAFSPVIEKPHHDTPSAVSVCVWLESLVFLRIVNLYWMLAKHSSLWEWKGRKNAKTNKVISVGLNNCLQGEYTDMRDEHYIRPNLLGHIPRKQKPEINMEKQRLQGCFFFLSQWYNPWDSLLIWNPSELKW